ncbi:hypothetical protein IU474_07555 [Nocardia otitidiscaviarum]|uniref:hypothetical protein n=1 Tax=Nocardia otitidiscaviarum TaxID=1823 RepID=UPI0018937CF8|nr:hypothetical protein [Nocardia otitidiscaviarum]MBF6236932.1 hypothetical protein [Nocardia otitidiscaviarum]
MREELTVGPGRLARWSTAVALLAAAAAVLLGRLLIADYAREVADATRPWRSSMRYGSVELAGLLWPWLVAALVALVAVRHSPQLWARVSLVASVPVGLLTAVPPLGSSGLRGGERVFASAAPVLSAVAVAAIFLLVGGAGRALTRPLAADIVDSAVRLRFRLRDAGRTRFVIAGDLVRLLRPRPVHATQRRAPELNHLAIPFARIESVTVVHLDGARDSHPLPNGTALPLSEGPAVRVVGAGQEWLLPLDEAEAVASLLRARIRACSRTSDPAPTSAQWQAAMRQRESIRASGTGKGSRAPSYYRLGTILFTALTVASFVANESWVGKVAGAFFFGLGALGCGVAWSNAADAVRLAEQWPEGVPTEER